MQDSKCSGSAEKKNFTKPKGQNTSTYFHCKQQGHRSFQCSKCLNLIENESDVKDTPNDPKGKETEVETKELEIVNPYDGETLMVLKNTTSTAKKK